MNQPAFRKETTYMFRCLWKRREVVLELQWLRKQRDLCFPPPASHQTSNPRDMPPHTDVPHPMMRHHPPPPSSAWRWQQRSTFAFGAKSPVFLFPGNAQGQSLCSGSPQWGSFGQSVYFLQTTNSFDPQFPQRLISVMLFVAWCVINNCLVKSAWPCCKMSIPPSFHSSLRPFCICVSDVKLCSFTKGSTWNLNFPTHSSNK